MRSRPSSPSPPALDAIRLLALEATPSPPSSSAAPVMSGSNGSRSSRSSLRRHGTTGEPSSRTSAGSMIVPPTRTAPAMGDSAEAAEVG
eukprot:scaffold225105_cov32-Tisochrysis_lutea.AAC.3